MARGGSRLGAGRRPKLETLTRLELGAECEGLFLALWRDASDKLCDEYAARGPINDIRAEADALPVSVRAKWLQSQAGLEYLEEVEEARRAMRRTPDFALSANPYFEFTAPRPKGVKNGICREVAAKHNLAGVGPAYVRKCWAEFRAVKKAAASHED